jgi:hypothetical protein
MLDCDLIHLFVTVCDFSAHTLSEMHNLAM